MNYNKQTIMGYILKKGNVLLVYDDALEVIDKHVLMDNISLGFYAHKDNEVAVGEMFKACSVDDEDSIYFFIFEALKFDGKQHYKKKKKVTFEQFTHYNKITKDEYNDVWGKMLMK